MRLDDFRSSDNIEDRRGMGGGGGLPIGRGGIGIGGLLIVLVISYFTGINPLMLIGGYESVTGSGQQSEAPAGQEGTPSDQSGKFVSQVLGSTEDVWTQVFQEQAGSRYKAPHLVLFSGGTVSACGSAQSAMGPFYCPNDKRIYLDTEFYDELQNRFKVSGNFAQAYVIAHEVGHHVQDELGILGEENQKQQAASTKQSNAIQVLIELQADCFAGVWAAHNRDRIEPGDVESGLNAAHAIGDDTLQQEAQGRVVPDSFTHGTSAERMKWLKRGIDSGDPNQCDTFQAGADG
jgi:uncharacterized protein